MAQQLEIRVDPHLAGLAPDHPTALDARDELLSDLTATSGLRPVERHLPNDGGKGAGLAELLIGLSGAGSLTALTRIVRLWLQRDRRRSLTVTVTVDGPGPDKVIRIEGERISLSTLTEALHAATGTTAHSAAHDDNASSEDEPSV